MRDDSDLVLHSLSDGKPVQFLEHWPHMISPHASHHDTRKSILYPLKLVKILCSGAVQHRVSVVDPRTDDAACHGISYLLTECRSDMPQGSDMEVTVFHDTCDMVIKRQALV